MSTAEDMTPGFAAEICKSLHDIFRDADHIAVRRFEDQGSGELITRLTPAVALLLERASDAMAHILEHYESQEDDGFSLESTEDEVVPIERRDERSSPRLEIADLSFIAVTELRQHRQRVLAHRITTAPQEIISGCGSALRAIKKCLYAVEPLLCQLEHKPALLPPRLETSLAVRRHYRKLWSFAASLGVVEERAVRGALRGAGTRIAILVGSDVYNLLREDDRFRIRDLQTRILAWLGDGHDPQVALRIWQDFALFVEMLRQINLREELVEHDRGALRNVTIALGTGGPPLSSTELKDQLRSLLGIDDELDLAIQNEASSGLLLSEVLRVAGHLQAHAAISESVAS